MDITQIRYRNARHLLNECGSLTAFAEKIGKVPTQVSSFAGSNPRKGIGSKIAREIEMAFGKPRGWLDRINDEGAIPHIVPTRKVPLISWANAGSWCESPDNHQPGDADEWLVSPFPFSDNAYCLVVIGDSMFPEYREGERILVDPGIEPTHGSDVVARTPDGSHTFKRLQITPEGTYLLALNPDHPNRKIELPEGTHICGSITGSWMKR